MLLATEGGVQVCKKWVGKYGKGQNGQLILIISTHITGKSKYQLHYRGPPHLRAHQKVGAAFGAHHNAHHHAAQQKMQNSEQPAFKCQSDYAQIWDKAGHHLLFLWSFPGQEASVTRCVSSPAGQQVITEKGSYESMHMGNKGETGVGRGTVGKKEGAQGAEAQGGGVR